MRQGESAVHAQEVAEKLSDRVPRLLLGRTVLTLNGQGWIGCNN